MNQFTPLPADRQGEKLGQYLPTGRAWENKFNPNSVLGGTLKGLGQEFYRLEVAIELLSQEFDIRQTTLLIREWEISVGIPDSCFTIDGDLAQRRANVLVKIQDKPVVTVQDFIDVAALFGAVVRIEPGAVHGVFPLLFPFTFYDSVKTAKFTMIVDQPGVQEVFQLTYPLPFSAGINGIIECLFLKLRPSNAQIIFRYGLIDDEGNLLPPPAAGLLGAQFDGTDFQRRMGDLTTNVDGKKYLTSFFLQLEGTETSAVQQIWNSEDERFRITRTASKHIQVVAENTASTVILDQDSTGTTVEVDGQWHHILASGDMAVAGSGKIFIDGVDVTTETTFTDDEIDYTRPDHAIGATVLGADKLTGSLSELYVNFAENLDLTIPGNVSKFRTLDNNPVILGTFGELPTGTPPIVYAPNGDATQNSASGGNFATIGTLIPVPGPSTGDVLPPPFAPDQLAGLKLWLDASDTATITEELGGAVSQWDDKSGNGNNAAQGTGANQPITGVNTINGLNVINFDAIDDQLQISANASLAGFWATGGTILAVYRSALVTGFGRLMSSGAEWGLFKVTSGTQFGMVVDFTATNSDFRSDNQYSPNTSEIIAITYDGSSDANEPVWYLNGSIIPPGTITQPVGTYVSGDGSMGIGNETFSNINPFDGAIAEMTLYNRILNTDELLEIHTYLSDKWTLPFFSPIQIPGLELWLDAADPATITESAGAVSQWDDKSGNGFDVTQGTGASQPATGVNTIGGLNTITFDGTDDRLNNLNFSGLDEADGYTIFFVAKPDDTGSDALLALTLISPENHGIFIQQDTNYRFTHRFPYGAAFGDNIDNVGSVTLDPQIMTYLRDTAGDNQEIFKNGSSIGSIAGLVDGAFDNTTKTLNLGSISTSLSGFSFNGDMGEVIIYGRALSGVERGEVGDYLSNKWFL